MAGKRDYLKDYHLQEDGSYEYTGATWTWQSLEHRASFVKAAWVSWTLTVSCLMAIGFMPPDKIGNSFLLLLPYALAIIACMLCAFALARITTDELVMRDHIYAKSFLRLPGITLFGMIVSVMACVGQIISLIGGKAELPLGGLVVLFCAVSAASFLRLYHLVAAVELDYEQGKEIVTKAAEDSAVSEGNDDDK